MSFLRIEGLEKRFGDSVILENVNADIEKGDIISVIGPSGTGKSTLLRAINFLDPPTAGKVYFNGVEIDKNNINNIRCKMGMVFQNFGLFSHLNIIDNLCVGPIKLLGKTKEEAVIKATELLKTVGLTERTYHMPYQLSGGQKQRVAIARCLAMEPEIILFDEPTSALDPTMVGEVIAVIRNLSKIGLTMMIVTHEMNFAREVSSHVYYMDEQGIYEQGSAQMIFENPQRPKTQKFIYKIRSFNFEIESKDFDYVKMLSEIDNFCFSHTIDETSSAKLRLIAEELIINIIVPKYNECSLTISFSEELKHYEVIVSYNGQNKNALDSAEDDLALKMVLGITNKIEHSFDNNIDYLKLIL